jgi:thymidylate kinase
MTKTLLKNVVAVVGCDGSGKSTLSNDLIAELAKKRQIEWVYLGQSSGNIADWIRSLPLIGPALARA